MIKNGSSKKNLVSKIAGGASMFKFSEKSINSDIGLRNIEAVKKALSKEGIKNIAEGTKKNTDAISNAKNMKQNVISLNPIFDQLWLVSEV